MRPERFIRLLIAVIACAYLAFTFAQALGGSQLNRKRKDQGFDGTIQTFASAQLEEGRRTFRYDTFGDEEFWGDQLRLHEAIAGSANGGVGGGLSPRAALANGLKVDLDALPKEIVRALQRGQVNLDDPKVTLQLLQLNAVVGVTGFFDGGTLRSVGIQCALCHSTVDDALGPGVGRRLDGWANRDLNIGHIVSLAPNLEPFASLLGVPEDTVRAVLNSWGPGKFDAELILDGKAFNGDRSAATLIPPAFGMSGVNLHTWTGWGSVTYWNAFVANLEMHGKGTFFDPRLDDASKFPIAAANRLGHITNDDDRITGKLPALHYYQLSLPAPAPPAGTFDAEAAERGDELFEGKARCASCHTDELYTEPGWNMHLPSEIGIDAFQANRSPDGRYRTSPLKGLWTHQKGGFFHDGRFATLMDVMNHYDTHFNLGLSDGEKQDLIDYVLSLSDEVEVHSADRFALEAGGDPGNGGLSVWPSPGRGGETMNLAFNLAGTTQPPADLEVSVFDVAGRRVVKMPAGTFQNGMVTTAWDGRDVGRRPVSAGVYFVRVTSVSAGVNRERRVVMK